MRAADALPASRNTLQVAERRRRSSLITDREGKHGVTRAEFCFEIYAASPTIDTRRTQPSLSGQGMNPSLWPHQLTS